MSTNNVSKCSKQEVRKVVPLSINDGKHVDVLMHLKLPCPAV